MLIGAFAQYFFGFTIFVLSSFLVLLVLVQRGRGGGLTGALGGPGGQSAFGTKAGDLFTRITIGVAAAWILLCASAVFMLRGRALPQTGGVDLPTVKGSANPGGGASGDGALGTDATGASSSGVTGAADNLSALPKLELPKLELPASTLPGSAEAAPATEPPAIEPPATESPAPANESPAPANESPAPATESPAPATESPAAPAVGNEPSTTAEPN